MRGNCREKGKKIPRQEKGGGNLPGYLIIPRQEKGGRKPAEVINYVLLLYCLLLYVKAVAGWVVYIMAFLP
jgi:hypothetical protein